MIFLPFLHFFSFIACLFLAVFVLYKDSKSLLNWLVSILMICYALWNLGDVILHNPDRSITKETAEIMQTIESVGWISFASALLCFSMVFSKKRKILIKKWFLAIVILVPLLFFYRQLTNPLTINPVRQSYGWSFEWSHSIWTTLFYVYYLVFTVASMLVVFFYGRKTNVPNEKKQANVIVVIIGIGIIIGSLMDIVIQDLGFNNIPPMTNLMVFVFASGVLYAMYKFRFLAITPTIAAEKIISVMDEFLILLNQEGIILNANKATLNSLAYNQEDLEGKRVTVLFGEESFKNKILEIILQGEVISNLDGSILSKNGETIPIIYSCAPVRENSGNILGTVFIARDISLHKQIENELVLAKEKAEESDRLKSAFLANMSHEIRTPMNGILGFSQLLKEVELTGQKQQEYIRIIESSGTRMLNIINDIIDISKIEAGIVEISLRESNINEQIEYIYKFFKPETDAKGLKLFAKKTLPAKEALVFTDREKVFAILTNLVKNAIKFSAKGTIEFGYDKISTPEGLFLKFFVKDNGIGIPKKKQEAVFERFIQADYSDKRLRDGNGLGLSISKAYVEKLGGKIWLESVEGEGSTFYFTLPFKKEKKEINPPGETVQTAASLNSIKDLKILIAEDDAVSERLISIIVKQFCHEILEAKNGIEAVEICRNNPELDLILMDIQMPLMDGYEATRKIRKFNKDVIIFAQTAFSLSGDKEKSLEAGCNDYIAKPIDRDELLGLIQKYFKENHD